MNCAMHYSTKGVNIEYMSCERGYLLLHLQLPTKSPTYNYLGTVTLHNMFPLYKTDNIGTGLWRVRIWKGVNLNVPYDI